MIGTQFILIYTLKRMPVVYRKLYCRNDMRFSKIISIKRQINKTLLIYIDTPKLSMNNKQEGGVGRSRRSQNISTQLEEAGVGIEMKPQSFSLATSILQRESRTKQHWATSM